MKNTKIKTKGFEGILLNKEPPDKYIVALKIEEQYIGPITLKEAEIDTIEPEVKT